MTNKEQLFEAIKAISAESYGQGYWHGVNEGAEAESALSQASAIEKQKSEKKRIEAMEVVAKLFVHLPEF